MEAKDIIIPVLAFLLGAVITAFGYTLAFSNKLAGLQSTVTQLTNLINNLKTPDSMIKDLTRVCTKTEELEQRLDRHETAHTVHTVRGNVNVS